MSRISFKLPLRGSLVPNGEDDPLIYYYHPVVGPLYRARTRDFLSLLKPAYGSILEVGYGSGILMPTLATLTDNLHGIDIETRASEVEDRLKILGVKVSLIQGDICKTPYPDHHFDLVIGIGIFQYFKEPQTVMAEMKRILKPQGYLLAGIPRVDDLMHQLFHLIGFHRSNICHQIDYKQFIQAASKDFKLIKHIPFPRILPSSFALFHSLLFQRI